MHLHDRISHLLKKTVPDQYSSVVKQSKSIHNDCPADVVSQQILIPIDNARENVRLSVTSATANYRNSATLLTYTTPEGQSMPFGLRDVLVIGAVANTHLLLRGSSGCGKTLIANGIMSAFFSSGYAEQHITPGTSAEDFVGLDFGVMQRGYTLEDAIIKSKIISAPGVILNEVNRTPEMLQNVLIPFLDRKFSYKTKEFKTGILWKGGQYQYVVGTMNEGMEYGGTCMLDRAVRERFGLEISFDQFPLRLKDQIQGEQYTLPAKSCQIELLSLASAALDIHLTDEAAALMTYVTGFDNCLKSNTGTKRGIAFNAALCEGCHHAQPMGNVCGNIFAPSKRVLDTWLRISRAMVLWAGYVDVVSAQDLLVIAPFVFEGKGVLSAHWVREQWQGNTYKALEHVLAEVYTRFCAVYKTSEGRAYLLGQQISSQHCKKLATRAEHLDPWVMNQNNI